MTTCRQMEAYRRSAAKAHSGFRILKSIFAKQSHLTSLIPAVNVFDRVEKRMPVRIFGRIQDGRTDIGFFEMPRTESFYREG